MYDRFSCKMLEEIEAHTSLLAALNWFLATDCFFQMLKWYFHWMILKKCCIPDIITLKNKLTRNVSTFTRWRGCVVKGRKSRHNLAGSRVTFLMMFLLPPCLGLTVNLKLGDWISISLNDFEVNWKNSAKGAILTEISTACASSFFKVISIIFLRKIWRRNGLQQNLWHLAGTILTR